MLPSAGRGCAVGPGEIGAGNLEVKHGLAQGLILSEDDLLCIVLVGGAETCAFAGNGINTIVFAAPKGSTNETVARFHNHFHATARIDKTEPAALANSGRISAR
jgi:hypothetical protein